MRIGSKVYVCQYDGIDEYGNPKYKAPKPMITALNDLTVMPKTGYMSILQYGASVSERYNVIARIDRHEGFFNENDLWYVDGAKPSPGNEKFYGEFANAICDSVLEQNLYYNLTLKKREA